MNRPVLKQERFLDPGKQSACEAGSLSLVRKYGRHDGKFVTTQSGRETLGSAYLLDAFGELPKQQVAESVTVDIVDRLETIDIKHQHGAELIERQVGGQTRELVMELAAVGQSGKRVVLGELQCTGFGVGTFRHFTMQKQKIDHAEGKSAQTHAHDVAEDKVKDAQLPIGSLIDQIVGGPQTRQIEAPRHDGRRNQHGCKDQSA